MGSLTLTLRLTLSTWKAFIRVSLEGAYIHLFLYNGFSDEVMDTESDLNLENKAGPTFICHPSIRELTFVIKPTEIFSTSPSSTARGILGR